MAEEAVYQSAPNDNRRLMALPGIIATAGALLTAVVSFAVLLGLTPLTPDAGTTLALIGVNAAFVLVLLALIAREAHRIYAARKGGKAAARLHVRIVAMFSLVAAIPAILVAVIASITLDLGLDRWFELRTRAIVQSSMSIAEAYVRENASNLQGTTLSMAIDLDRSRTLYSLDRNGFRQLLTQQTSGRGLDHAVLLRDDQSVIMAADMLDSVQIPAPPDGAMESAAEGRPVLFDIPPGNLIGALIRLREIPDAFLYTLRELDSEVIKAQRIVASNTGEYRALEANRTNTQVAFALLYLVVTLAIVLAAIWTGIAVADRLVRPIRQLIGAAGAVSIGNLDVAVPVRTSDGDVASLGDTFNKMTFQLKTQRDELISARDVIDERRRFTEAVLSGVTAGVIGVDAEGTVSIVNRSAETMLSISASETVGKNLSTVLPQIGRVFEQGRSSGRPVYRDQVTFYRMGAERTFNVQITTEEGGEAEDHSYVVTVDDITDLVQAQRTSAWADVARRIAHEIKNPLTPIQLSAERIRRRYGKVITEDREVFDQCTDTIIRQVGDIGRMVDEFSAFARMPKPDIRELDLREPLREAAFLVDVSRPDTSVEMALGKVPLVGRFDTRLMSQAFGNVIKNAAEAIDARARDTENYHGYIRVQAAYSGREIEICIMDNGKGLPRENRQRLLEPYMTTREKGTGLGLAIVRKIIEDHGGRLELHDAPADFHNGKGAMIRMILPGLAADGNERAGAGKPTGTEKVNNGV
ncbi:ATP-binding protein [Chelativorans sp. YIM 93263]